MPLYNNKYKTQQILISLFLMNQKELCMSNPLLIQTEEGLSAVITTNCVATSTHNPQETTTARNASDHEDKNEWKVPFQGQDYFDIWESLKCDEKFSIERPIPTQSTWKQTIEAYSSIVEDSKLDYLNDSFSVGIRVEHIEGKGRGVFATHPIKNGQLIWTSKRTARFDSGDDYKQFLSKFDADLACDLLHWSYIYDDKIIIQLDEGSLENGSYEESNIGCYVGVDCGDSEYALIDIDTGDEIISVYNESDVDKWNEKISLALQ